MRIEFLKDYKDPREGRTKTFKKGKVTDIGGDWVKELIKDKIAKPATLEMSLNIMEAKMKKAGITDKD